MRWEHNGVPYLSVWFPVTPWWVHPARGDKDYSRFHRKRDSPGDAGDGPRASSALNAPDVAETTTIWLFNSSPWKIPNKWRFIAGKILVDIVHWLVVYLPTPLKNDGVKVSWDDEIPN